MDLQFRADIIRNQLLEKSDSVRTLYQETDCRPRIRLSSIILCGAILVLVEIPQRRDESLVQGLRPQTLFHSSKRQNEMQREGKYGFQDEDNHVAGESGWFSPIRDIPFSNTILESRYFQIQILSEAKYLHVALYEVKSSTKPITNRLTWSIWV